LPLLPRIAAFGEQMIVEPTALLKLPIEEALLLLGRVEAILERLKHVFIDCLTARCVKRRGRFIPSPKERVFWPFCDNQTAETKNAGE
jgi:hypothetical protein